jgi:hypothetical protein
MLLVVDAHKPPCCTAAQGIHNSSARNSNDNTLINAAAAYQAAHTEKLSLAKPAVTFTMAAEKHQQSILSGNTPAALLLFAQAFVLWLVHCFYPCDAMSTCKHASHNTSHCLDSSQSGKATAAVAATAYDFQMPATTR